MKGGYKNYILFIKILALTATICTFILGVGLIALSLVPGDRSRDFTDNVTNSVDGAFRVSEKYDTINKTEGITATRSEISKFYFIGEKFTPKLEFLPANTKDTSVGYRTDNDVAKCDADGITFIKKGKVNLKIYLLSDETVYDEVTLSCAGEDITDPNHPERLEITFDGGYDKETAVDVGNSKGIVLNDGKTNPSVLGYDVKNPEILAVYGGKVFGRKAGTTLVGASLKRGKNKADISFTVTVKDGGKQTINALKMETSEFLHGETIADVRELFIVDNGFLKKDYECIPKSANENIVFFNGRRMYAKSIGTVKLRFTSVYNPSVYIEKTVTVKPIKPDNAKIIGSAVVMPNEKVKFVFNHSPEKYPDSVKWSVVKGKAFINEKGELVAKWFGNVVVRGQSTIDESIVAERTVSVKMFSSAYFFVRKLMGHFGLNALWGLGIFATLLLTCKRKYIVALSPLFTLTLASLSEILQYFTPGRYCLLTDVVIDFCGSLIGISVAIAAFSIIFLIFRLFGKSNFKKLCETIKIVNLKNVFKKTEDLEKLLSASYGLETTAIDYSAENIG